MVTMKLIGAERLLQALDPARANSNLGKALGAAANIVFRAAKENASGKVLKYRTGRLTGAVTQDVDLSRLRAMIGVTGKGNYTRGGYKRGETDQGVIGWVHEHGTIIRPIPPNKTLRFYLTPAGTKTTGKRYEKALAQGAYPLVVVKSVRIKATHWFSRALTANRADIAEVFRGSLQRSLRP